MKPDINSLINSVDPDQLASSSSLLTLYYTLVLVQGQVNNFFQLVLNGIINGTRSDKSMVFPQHWE